MPPNRGRKGGEVPRGMHSLAQAKQQSPHTPHKNPNLYITQPHLVTASIRASDMMAAFQPLRLFDGMREADLRQWVEANPGDVNHRDAKGNTPLHVASSGLKGLNLTLWLLDERGANVNARDKYGNTPLHVAESLDVLDALLDRNADPILPNNGGMPPLMNHLLFGRAENVERLLQDPRVRATVDMRNQMGDAAIHLACNFWHEQSAISLVYLLVAAGANPLLANRRGKRPLLEVREHHPSHHNLIALLEEDLAEAETTSLLVKVRRFVVAPRSVTTTHSYLDRRLVEVVPQVTLAPLTTAHNDEEEEEEERKPRSMLTFVTGMEGGADGQGMEKDHFLKLMKFLMHSWDPLRRGRGDDLQRL